MDMLQNEHCIAQGNMGDHEMKLSILIATYNRAEVLRKTLDVMCAVDREGLEVEFVVIDNNSTDNTGVVIDSFKERLPIRHLFQPKQGKSAALNLALDTVELGDIVVFTDDDVVPKIDWLIQVVGALDRYGQCNVFGGKVFLIWPDDAPDWARHECFEFAFCPHDKGGDMEYRSGHYPTGANMFVRKRVLDAGHRFSEGLGPSAGEVLGEDTIFMKELCDAGEQIFYAHNAGIGHHVSATLLSKGKILKRAYGMGRSYPHKNPSDATMTRRFAGIRILIECASLLVFGSGACILYLLRFSVPICSAAVGVWWKVGYHHETASQLYSKHFSR